jgi:hypothetical protein
MVHPTMRAIKKIPPAVPPTIKGTGMLVFEDDRGTVEDNGYTMVRFPVIELSMTRLESWSPSASKSKLSEYSSSVFWRLACIASMSPTMMKTIVIASVSVSKSRRLASSPGKTALYGSDGVFTIQ